jgi:menaquinone-dependent protoporphyrinogen oxidase
MARILVLYGTTEGQTVKIASTLADTFREHGFDAEVVRAGNAARDLDEYSGVVVAASVHGGRYQRPVEEWVRTHARALAAKPTAFVSVCLGVLQQNPGVQAEVSRIVERFFMRTGWRATTSTIVAGALLYTRYNWLKRWLMQRIVRKAGGDTDTSRDYEYTDWAAVRAFGRSFEVLVRQRTPVRAETPAMPRAEVA